MKFTGKQGERQNWFSLLGLVTLSVLISSHEQNWFCGGERQSLVLAYWCILMTSKALMSMCILELHKRVMLWWKLFPPHISAIGKVILLTALYWLWYRRDVVCVKSVEKREALNMALSFWSSRIFYHLVGCLFLF